MGPKTAFVLLIFGLFGIYAELIRPGRVAPGVAGAAAAIAGGYFLFRGPLHPVGLVLLAAGAALLVAEACWGSYLIFGGLGAAALIAGFYLLLPPSARLAPALEIPLSTSFGMASAFLAAAAKRARRNKREDLDRPK